MTATVGTMLVLGTTLVAFLVCLNMIYQYRTMDGRAAFWLAVKIGLIGISATNWGEFNVLASAILNGIGSIAGSLQVRRRPSPRSPISSSRRAGTT